MNLTCLPSGTESIGNNFVEVQTDHRGFSTGPGMSARGLKDNLLILFHDKNRHRGCIANLSGHDAILETIAAMRHHMVNRWGTVPRDIEVLLAGGLKFTAEFSALLKNQFNSMHLSGRILDTRRQGLDALGPAPLDPPPQHLYYHPASARVELVLDPTEPGGRAYGHAEGVELVGCTQLQTA